MDALDLSNLDVSTLKKEDLPPPSADEASKGLEYARNRAAVALDHAIFELQKRVYREDNSIRQILDMSDHFAKVSGLLAKQAAAAAPVAKITFSFGQKPAQGATIEGEVVLGPNPESDDVLLPDIPPSVALLALPISDDLVSYADE